MTGFSDSLVRFALETRNDALPGEVMDVLRLSMLDWLAVGYAGRDEPVSQILRAQVAAEGGAADATVFGGVSRVPARAAALANGTISHALDYDDTHFDHIGHPSVAVMPAVFALAEKHDIPVDIHMPFMKEVNKALYLLLVSRLFYIRVL